MRGGRTGVENHMVAPVPEQCVLGQIRLDRIISHGSEEWDEDNGFISRVPLAHILDPSFDQIDTNPYHLLTIALDLISQETR